MATRGHVPLTIIGGFLGTGKTSLLNHLLTQNSGRRITAMVNDFGALNIDAELIAAKHGNQIALANGCVCCSIGDDLMRSFVEVMQQTPLPDHIIIEASGVADPSRIAGFASVDPQMRLDGIVTLVDAAAHDTHAHDPYLADNYQKQLQAAHLFIITKPDLAGAAATEKLRRHLAHDYPHVPLTEAVHGQLAMEIILGLNDDDDPPLPEKMIDHGLTQWAGHVPPMSRHKLAEKLQSLRPHVLRAKGILQDADGAYVLHLAGGHISMENHDGTASGHFVIIGTPDMPDAAHLKAMFSQADAA